MGIKPDIPVKLLTLPYRNPELFSGTFNRLSVPGRINYFPDCPGIKKGIYKQCSEK